MGPKVFGTGQRVLTANGAGTIDDIDWDDERAMVKTDLGPALYLPFDEMTPIDDTP